MSKKQIILWACWFNCSGPKPDTRYLNAENEEGAINKYLEGLESSKYSNIPDRNTVKCRQILPQDIQGLSGAKYLFVYKILGKGEEKSVMAHDLLGAISQIISQNPTIVISGIIIQQFLEGDKLPMFRNIE